MTTVIIRENLHIVVQSNVYPDADLLLDSLEQMRWNRGKRREHKDYGVVGTSYTLKFGGYNRVPTKVVQRDVLDWSNEPYILGARDVSCPDSDYCVIQRYNDGTIGIGKHKDNEMDSRPIFGMSLGATRTLVLYPPVFNRIDRDPIRISLPHNSLYIIHPPTNKYWMHAIESDMNVTDVRYSLTFRRSK